jgi:glucokinase
LVEDLSILVDPFNPEITGIGGLATHLGSSLVEPARRVVQREAPSVIAKICRITPTDLGESIGDVAAICVAMACACAASGESSNLIAFGSSGRIQWSCAD